MKCEGLSIELLNGERADELHEIYARYLSGAGVAVDKAQLREFLGSLLHYDWVLALGAIHERTLVGFGMGNLTYTNIRCGIALHLGDLFVDRGFRGRGVSERLLTDIRELAVQRGAMRIFGNVAPRASRYFLRHGWKNNDQLFLHWDIGA